MKDALNASGKSLYQMHTTGSFKVLEKGIICNYSKKEGNMIINEGSYLNCEDHNATILIHLTTHTARETLLLKLTTQLKIN